jgi:hypothetical protein
MKTQTVDLGRLFNLDNLINDTRLRLLSAAGGSNDHDADYSDRLKLLRKFISMGRVPRKPGGDIYTDAELLCLPLDKMQKLYDETEPTMPAGERGQNPEQLAITKMNASVDLARVFNDERGLQLLSAKLDRSTFGKDESIRANILREFVRMGRMPLKKVGVPFTAEEMFEIPIETLKVLAANVKR